MGDHTEREKQLAAELARTLYVWKNFINYLSSGYYPSRDPQIPVNVFRGTAEERLMEIFKVMDVEVHHIGDALAKAGFDARSHPLRAEQIFDEISHATGITTTSHEKC